MTTDTIKAIQKQIVTKLETGEDVSELSRRLAQERAKIAAQAEIEELKKIAGQRQQLRDEATKAQEKVKLQGEAIDTFLKARDAITEALMPIVEKARELPKLQSECYSQYHDAGQLAWTKKLPEGYLPKGLSVPILEGKDGVTYSYDRAAQAVWYISAGLGLLQSLIRIDRPIPEREATEFEAIDPLTSEVELNCRVCNHEKVAEINKALQDGRPLRELEVEFNVSRSTLSRHKNNCLNLGAIRFRD